MKKSQRTLAVILATVLTAGTVMTCGFTTNAQEGYVAGDVDRDGIITGHDAALVTRYLNVDPDCLDATALALADINGDGVVDATDADAIHAEEVYAIGDVFGTSATFGEAVFSSMNSLAALKVYAASQVNLLVVDEEASFTPVTAYYGENGSRVCELGNTPYFADGEIVIDAVSYNLLDADADGAVTSLDALTILYVYANSAVYAGDADALEAAIYVDGRYDLNPSFYE